MITSNMKCAKRFLSLSLVSLMYACLSGPAINLAPNFMAPKFVVPENWQGMSPFVKANPSEGQLKMDWWKIFNDPMLNSLEEKAMLENADLQAAAERFLQARNRMQMVRSKLIPNFGLGFGLSNNKQSSEALFRGPLDPVSGASISPGILASWEPDFWSSIRSSTRREIYRAEEQAANYALAKLSLQAELASEYFTLRGLQAEDATYRLSIDYYKQSLDLANQRYTGGLASEIDVFRAKFLLSSTEALRLEIQNKIQVTLHSIAVLINQAPTNFTIQPKDELVVDKISIPSVIPATLLERRPDIASMERKMAQANQEIGIAKAAFFPNVSFNTKIGMESEGFNFSQLSNSFWSYGSLISLPIFQGGFRRAQLQQSWSMYRETEDIYRSTVLNAFREVENSIAQTNLLSLQATKLDEAVDSALQTQNMTNQLYTAGLSNSLELIYSQLSTLTARIDAIEVKTQLLKSEVGLIRSLGGGWDRQKLPPENSLDTFKLYQLNDLENPPKSGDIDINSEDNTKYNDLMRSYTK